MNAFTSLTAQQLRHAADLKERIQNLETELARLFGGTAGAGVGAFTGRKKLSARGIANIRAGVRKRMAALRAKGGRSRPRRKMSAAGRAAIAAAAKARWAKAKAAGRTRL